MALTTLDYYYEQKRNSRGTKQSDFLKIQKKIGLDPVQLSYWVCKIVDDRDVCVIFFTRIANRDVILDRDQMLSLGLIS